MRKGSVCAALITPSSPGEACSTEYASIGTAATESALPSALSVSPVQNSAKRRCPRPPSAPAKPNRTGGVPPPAKSGDIGGHPRQDGRYGGG